MSEIPYGEYLDGWCKYIGGGDLKTLASVSLDIVYEVATLGLNIIIL